ncbi:MAG: hypothetical protein LBP72_03350 [Dysgonamonadaceae bacterium]|jgi:hypothetical protein|nr:hypothetical protein [Dysgonamonadaceae bacterium]
MEIEFNKQGAPLLFTGRTVFGNTTGAPIEQNKDLKKIAVQVTDTKSDREFTDVSGIRLLSWGSNNDFPQWADKIITGTGVLNTGLKFIRNLTLGQGIYACRISGYDDKGNEVLEPYPDQSVNDLLSHRRIRRYMERTLRDYLKFGSAAIQLLPNADGSKIVGLNPYPPCRRPAKRKFHSGRPRQLELQGYVLRSLLARLLAGRMDIHCQIGTGSTSKSVQKQGHLEMAHPNTLLFLGQNVSRSRLRKYQRPGSSMSFRQRQSSCLSDRRGRASM